MATIEVPDRQQVLDDEAEVRSFLAERGVDYDVWQADRAIAPDADQDAILNAYAHVLDPYMEANGYTVADVIRVTPATPNLDAVRAKFLDEHTHTEDEVRFFVEGKGYFWFHQEDHPVFGVLCEPGDLISVPAGTRHWFDMGADPSVTAIRMFIDPAGWVPHYTESGVARRYNKPYDRVL